MTREELLELLAAARVPQADVQVLIVGSQSVLGAYPDSDLPDVATMSLEADVMYLRRGTFDQELTDVVDAHFGEGGGYQEAHGVYLQGVDENTCVLPAGWQHRLVRLAVLPPLATSAGGSGPDAAGIPVVCLDPHDLAVAKLAAGRPKDVAFVHALLGSGHLDPAEVAARAQALDPAAYPAAGGDVLRRLALLTRS